MSSLKSFVKSSDQSLFPIQHLPYGVFSDTTNPTPRIGVAIGEFILDLGLLEKEKLLSTSSFNQSTLNDFAALGPSVWSSVRKRIQNLLSLENTELQNHPLVAEALIPQNKATMLMPFKVEGFSDFYASEHHATNVGKLFRPNESPLLPNWKYLPVGYNGRASTVFVSGTKIRRPSGQIKPPQAEKPSFSAAQKLDFEVEMGIFVGVGNPDGAPITLDQAKSHIFGLVLLNDWSARDIQAFEYQPLGPFLSKSFATSISPWVVPMEALEPFMAELPVQQPETVAYLQQSARALPDVKLEVAIQPAGSSEATVVCRTTFKEMYWSMEQILAHHTVNNCIMKPGDLLGSGTISGSQRENWGSLLEITANGAQPIKLTDGSERKFLQDGDSVVITGYCENKDYRIGFGRLEGKIT